MDYKILRPFGTSIYHSTMNDEMMNTLKDIARTSRDDGLDFRQQLAGNITVSYTHLTLPTNREV